jgi:hypothetical protein
VKDDAAVRFNKNSKKVDCMSGHFSPQLKTKKAGGSENG